MRQPHPTPPCYLADGGELVPGQGAGGAHQLAEIPLIPPMSLSMAVTAAATAAAASAAITATGGGDDAMDEDDLSLQATEGGCVSVSVCVL